MLEAPWNLGKTSEWRLIIPCLGIENTRLAMYPFPSERPKSAWAALKMSTVSSQLMNGTSTNGRLNSRQRSSIRGIPDCRYHFRRRTPLTAPRMPIRQTFRIRLQRDLQGCGDPPRARTTWTMECRPELTRSGRILEAMPCCPHVKIISRTELDPPIRLRSTARDSWANVPQRGVVGDGTDSSLPASPNL